MSTPFDRPLVGYRFVLTQYGDTLLSVAARELGDASQWSTIIALNGMVYPYLTDDPAKAGTGVFLNGGYITVPGSTPGADTNDPNAVFGTDILLQNGLPIFVNGDIGTVSGVQNLKQALTNALDTDQGELLFHQTYGTEIRKLLGTMNNHAAVLLAAQYASDTVSADPRISSITSSVGTLVGDAISVTVIAPTVQGTTSKTGITY
jgi:phage baseplate assembly protein W